MTELDDIIKCRYINLYPFNYSFKWLKFCISLIALQFTNNNDNNNYILRVWFVLIVIQYYLMVMNACVQIFIFFFFFFLPLFFKRLLDSSLYFCKKYKRNVLKKSILIYNVQKFLSQLLLLSCIMLNFKVNVSTISFPLFWTFLFYFASKARRWVRYEIQLFRDISKINFS